MYLYIYIYVYIYINIYKCKCVYICVYYRSFLCGPVFDKVLEYY